MELRQCLVCARVYNADIKAECCGMSINYYRDTKPTVVVEVKVIKPPSKRALARMARDERKRLKEENPIKPSYYMNNRLRESIKRRDKHKCTECKSKTDLQVHHIVFRENGGTEEPSNLITLCEFCHADKHKDSSIYKMMRKGIV